MEFYITTWYNACFVNSFAQHIFIEHIDAMPGGCVCVCVLFLYHINVSEFYNSSVKCEDEYLCF